MKQFVAYYRVSTTKQGVNGLGIDGQRTAVAEFIKTRNGEFVAEFQEAESGRKADRPELAKAVARARLMGATLVVAKLDRLARDKKLFEQLMDADVSVAFCDLPNIPNGAIGKFILGVLAEVAQLEAGMIADRTKSALAAISATIEAEGSYMAKSGRVITKLGRDHVPADAAARGQEASRKARAGKADRFASDVAPAMADIEDGGITSLNGIARALNGMGIKTPRGSTWTPAAVSRVKARLATA